MGERSDLLIDVAQLPGFIDGWCGPVRIGGRRVCGVVTIDGVVLYTDPALFNEPCIVATNEPAYVDLSQDEVLDRGYRWGQAGRWLHCHPGMISAYERCPDIDRPGFGRRACCPDTCNGVGHDHWIPAPDLNWTRGLEPQALKWALLRVARGLPAQPSDFLAASKGHP